MSEYVLVPIEYFDQEEEIDDGFGMGAPRYFQLNDELHEQWIVRPGKTESGPIGRIVENSGMAFGQCRHGNGLATCQKCPPGGVERLAQLHEAKGDGKFYSYSEVESMVVSILEVERSYFLGQVEELQARIAEKGMASFIRIAKLRAWLSLSLRLKEVIS